MAFRKTKRSYGKKRRGLRRRATRRSNRLYRSLRPRNQYYFTRYSFYQAPLTSFTLDANGQKFGAIYARGIQDIYSDFAVVAMPNRTEFSALFDEYKVYGFDFELHPRFSQAATPPTTANSHIPTIYWFYDTDDSNPPASMSEVMEHAKVYSKQLKSKCVIRVRYPTIAGSVYQSGVSTGYQEKRAPWLDINSYYVPHYGVKFAIQGYALADWAGQFDIRVKWRLGMKNVR